MAAARQVKPDIDKGITSQGFYVVDADGKAYGFNNNRSVERVTGFIQRGLDAFAAAPRPSGKIPDGDVAAKWHTELPEGGASIRVHSRIRPLPAGVDPSNGNVARDHLWVYPNEILALAKDGKASESLVWRIARFQLVDNIRGEPDHWQAAEVKKAELKLTPAGRNRWTFQGDFAMETANGARGLTAKLEGRIGLNAAADRIEVFRAFGEGVAWGRSTYTPNPPEGRFPIVFAFDMTRDQWSMHVTPQAIFYGNEYQNPLKP